MRLSDLSIRRPVLATVMSLLLVLVGVVSYQRLAVREYPDIDSAVVTVETTYPGASAEIIETQITQVIEEELAGIEGIDFMTRSDEHTSELQSLMRISYAVFCLKKNKH